MQNFVCSIYFDSFKILTYYTKTNLSIEFDGYINLLPKLCNKANLNLSTFEAHLKNVEILKIYSDSEIYCFIFARLILIFIRLFNVLEN